MRHTRLLFMLLMAATFLFAIGYTEGVVAQETATPPPGSQPMVVKEAPPAAPKQDVIPTQPSPKHVWVAGYWIWIEGSSWVWVGGRWAVPPYEGGAWIPGHWGRGPFGWHWIPGHWAYY